MSQGNAKTLTPPLIQAKSQGFCLRLAARTPLDRPVQVGIGKTELARRASQIDQTTEGTVTNGGLAEPPILISAWLLSSRLSHTLDLGEIEGF